MKLVQIKEVFGKPEPPPTTIGEAMKRSGLMRRWQKYGPFDHFHGMLKWDYAMPSVISWEGCPHEFVDSNSYGLGGVDVRGMSINSFEHCNIRKASAVKLAGARIFDMHGVYEHIRAEHIVVPVAKNMVGLILIEGLSLISIAPIGPTLTLNNLKLEQILNKHIKDQDIAACQEELIDAGFEEEAGI